MVRWQWFEKEDELRQAATETIALIASVAIQERGTFRIVLAGGSTPQAIYQMLKDLPTDWNAWDIYFGD